MAKTSIAISATKAVCDGVRSRGKSLDPWHCVPRGFNMVNIKGIEFFKERIKMSIFNFIISVTLIAAIPLFNARQGESLIDLDTNLGREFNSDGRAASQRGGFFGQEIDISPIADIRI
ncbi:hypothetical protein DSO57_1009855 [Entomophthora muscae]|uniref:Uncharacterized protein n=1 Tax=Entomophthora muscae TaxID=34485 RepID=A0ACC2SJF5_9FUNG|nr:hypothetical protein DSO57_1009855 [Entomophthora muscae]